MKKIIIGAIVAILAIVAINAYILSQVEINNEKFLSVMLPQNTTHLSTYDKNLFKTKISTDITYPKDTINSLLGADLLQNDVKFRLFYTTHNFIFNLFSGFKTDGYVELMGFDEIMNKIFASKQIAKFSAISKANGDTKLDINLAKIDFKNEFWGFIASSPININFELNKNGLKKIATKIEKFNLQTNKNLISKDEILINFANYNYEINYKKPVKFDFYQLGLNDYIAKISLENLNMAFEDIKFSLKNIIDNTSLIIHDNKFDVKSIGNVKFIDIVADNQNINIINFYYDLLFKDFAKNFAVEFYDTLRKGSQNYDEIYNFCKTSPKFYVNSIDFTDKNSRNFHLDLKIGLENFNGDKKKIFDYAFLVGNLELNEHYLDIIFAKNLDMKEMIMSQIFIKNGTNLKTKFEFNKEKMDIIINNSAALDEIFGRF